MPGMTDTAQHRHHAIEYVELTVTDLVEAKRCYADAFGWHSTTTGTSTPGSAAVAGWSTAPTRSPADGGSTSRTRAGTSSASGRRPEPAASDLRAAEGHRAGSDPAGGGGQGRLQPPPTLRAHRRARRVAHVEGVQ